jgi:hypothetical protein
MSARATCWNRIGPASNSANTPRTLQDFSITKSPFDLRIENQTHPAFSIFGAIFVRDVISLSNQQFASDRRRPLPPEWDAGSEVLDFLGEGFATDAANRLPLILHALVS